MQSTFASCEHGYKSQSTFTSATLGNAESLLDSCPAAGKAPELFVRVGNCVVWQSVARQGPHADRRTLRTAFAFVCLLCFKVKPKPLPCG